MRVAAPRSLLLLAAVGLLACSPAAATDARQGKASIAVIVTGDDDGYLKPCECTSGMLGGLPRRHSLFRSLERKAASQLLLSNGRVTSPHTDSNHPVDPDLAEGVLAQDRMKFETMIFAMGEIGYRAMNLSPWELKLGRADLASVLNDGSFPVLATNLRLEGEPAVPVKKGVRVPWNGGEALVVGVIGFSQQALLGDADRNATLDEPAAAIAAAQNELGKDLPLIVLAQMSAKEGLELAKHLPQLVLLALPGHAGSNEEVPSSLSSTKPFVVTTGGKGKYVGLSLLTLGETLDFAFDALAVEKLYGDSDIVMGPLNILQQRLKEEHLLEHFYGKKATLENRRYVGSSECSNCHAEAVKKLASSKHMQAWKTMVDNGTTFDPDCVGCHVTGYTFKSGFAGEDKTPSLVNVTCEECHGPASLHIRDPYKPYDTMEHARATCLGKCHITEHSPSFDFAKYWPKIEHGRD